MKKYKQLDEAEKIKICQNKDARYDSHFVLAVKSTKIYCRPSCKARTPLEKNMSFYETPYEAENAGFRACKRCRPELASYRPEVELAQAMKRTIDEHYLEKEALNKAQKALYFSGNHLANVFKRYYGITPLEYRNRLREKTVEEKLLAPHTKILDVALECGFSSLSAFYLFFKKRYGMPPQAYRKTHGIPSPTGEVHEKSKRELPPKIMERREQQG